MNEVQLTVQNVRVRVMVLVLEKVIDGIDVVMGMDVIGELGEVTLVKGKVVWKCGRSNSREGEETVHHGSGCRG